MKTIKELTYQINAELKKLHPIFDWGKFGNCTKGDKTLYGDHISVSFYYDDEPVKATHFLRQQVTNIFKKYYSRTAKFYKVEHMQDGSYSPSKPMLQITILT